MMLTPRQRIRAALRGELADQVPFSVYWLMLPRGEAERRLRNQGLAVVERVPLYRAEMPHVQLIIHESYDKDVPLRRETLRTPHGEVHATKKMDPNYGTSWWNMDYYVKGPNDYRVMEFAIRDIVYRPNYEAVLLAQERLGEDGYVIGNTEYTPMNKLLYEWLGPERFALDLHDRPDAVLSLYWLLREKQREMYRVCAASPVELAIYGGNIHQDMIGLRRFSEYYLPCLDDFADHMHDQRKLSACHLDAPMASLVQAVAGSKIDVVEAFTPAPTCDVTVAAARAAWPGKVLWMNFPSSVLIEPCARVRETTLRILKEAAPGDRFLIGVTEDVPEDCWRSSLAAISEAILEHGKLPLQR
jgi:hypothetical protein